VLAQQYEQQSEQLAQRFELIQQEKQNALRHYVSNELAVAQQAIMHNTANFVDKAKADLATELPTMMHANAAILKADLNEALSQMQAQAISFRSIACDGANADWASASDVR
jgi:methionyl-tRNA synthetase